VADRTGLGAPAGRGEPGTLRVGSVGGIDVMVRSSWLLMAALIAYLLAPQIERTAPDLGAWKYVAGVAVAVLLTLSLLLHELSHALMSKHFGIGVRSITLHFIGGVTEIDGEPASPKQELWISVVGPLTSIGVGAAGLGLGLVVPVGLLGLAVDLLAWANIVVGVLNLVPGFPLDGGRVLRAAVWKLTGDPHRGTAAAGWAGRGVAVLMFSSPLLMRAAGRSPDVIDFMIALVFGWFLWSAATGAIVSARVRSRLPALQGRALARRTVAVPAELPLAEAIERARLAEAPMIVTLHPDGAPAGIVNQAAAVATPQERRAWVPVGTVSRTLTSGTTLPADIAGEPLIRAMQAAPAAEYLLVEPDGAIYGVLLSADVDRQFDATR
jgi:Zn-dependent protease